MKIESRPIPTKAHLLIQMAVECGLPESHSDKVVSIQFTAKELKVTCAPTTVAIGGVTVAYPSEFILPFKD